MRNMIAFTVHPDMLSSTPEKFGFCAAFTLSFVRYFAKLMFLTMCRIKAPAPQTITACSKPGFSIILPPQSKCMLYLDFIIHVVYFIVNRNIIHTRLNEVNWKGVSGGV